MNSEKLEEIVAEMRREMPSCAHGLRAGNDGSLFWVDVPVQGLSYRIEDAHKAEIDKKDAIIAHHEKVNDEQDADNSRLRAENAKMREAFHKIINGESDGGICCGCCPEEPESCRRCLQDIAGDALAAGEEVGE